MYHSPQTFFYDDDSPPSSPVERKIPTFHLSPAPINKAEKTQHRRWNSLSKTKQNPSPFSYEYVFEEGKLAGLAEYHPDHDYLHYSSSRGSSTTNSRNPSRRTSFQQSGRSSLDTRPSGEHARFSTESERSQEPLSSPKKTDVLKRALSLSNVRGRTSSEGRRRLPSPPAAPRPQVAPTTIPTNANVPTHISVPVHPLVQLNPSAAFEAPRAAPAPPQRRPSKSVRIAQPPTTIPQSELKRKDSKNHETAVKRSSLYAVEGKQRSFEGPKKPTITIPSKDTNIEPVMSGALPIEERVVAPRPPLRRKTSKFVEHLDDKTFKIELEPMSKMKTNGAPAVPFIPPFDFQFSTEPTLLDISQSPKPESKPKSSMRRSQSLARRVPITTTHPVWPFPDLTYSSTAAQKALPTPPIPKFALGPRTQPLQPMQSNIMRKRSALNLKPISAEAIKPVLAPATALMPTSMMLKRATSMRTRPTAVWADVCMAEVKPTLMSPVVASGHARMISC